MCLEWLSLCMHGYHASLVILVTIIMYRHGLALLFRGRDGKKRDIVPCVESLSLAWTTTALGNYNNVRFWFYNSALG
jgi:hypothetical protein